MRKPKIKQLKIVASMMIASFFILTYLLYLNWNKIVFRDSRPSSLIVTTPTKYDEGTPMKHVPLNEIYPEQLRHYPNESYEFEDFKPVNMIDTPGCKIPVSMVDYIKHIKKEKKYNGTCGKRAVFLKKVGTDKVQALIKPKIMKKYLRKSVKFGCCYRFISKSHKLLKFTKCAKFEDSAFINLETDFVNVQCFDYDKRNKSHLIYDDVYAFAKKINVTNSSQNNCRVKYNVLMIGIDSMSLSRFVQTLSRTSKYFENHSWLGYRGYHKIADNTLPNMMAFLIEKNVSDTLWKCANKMDQCHNLFIWNKFKAAGYVTAYGEDGLIIPDTFTKQYAFKIPPTDHYMRPFFSTREKSVDQQTLICAGKIPSGQQVLNYALDFANTYRSDQFFGLFWMNSFSHSPNSRPQDADVMIENFFNQLAYTGVLKNTFVIALSDHGIRFGDRRMEVESYYDERMPFLFVLTPGKFVGRYPLKIRSLAINQHRLVTPYDLYHTLNEINDISSCKNKSNVNLEACPTCHSMFEVVSSNRTCEDLGIHNKWCSCHKLYPLPVQDPEGIKSVQTAVSYIKNIIKTINTTRCHRCVSLSLKNIIRTHFYYHKNKVSIYYVVAFTMTPGYASYEATVLLKEGKREIIHPVSIISAYRGVGQCTTKHEDRIFCVCGKLSKC